MTSATRTSWRNMKKPLSATPTITRPIRSSEGREAVAGEVAVHVGLGQQAAPEPPAVARRSPSGCRPGGGRGPDDSSLSSSELQSRAARCAGPRRRWRRGAAPRARASLRSGPAESRLSSASPACRSCSRELVFLARSSSSSSRWTRALSSSRSRPRPSARPRWTNWTSPGRASSAAMSSLDSDRSSRRPTSGSSGC